MAKEKIGILGGTFNPIHEGHMAMAMAAKAAARLDRVLLMPDSVPPHKTGIAPAADRWRMLCAAAAAYPELEPSRMELDRAGTTYTYDTLTELRSRFPKAELYYIIGADTLMELKNWYRSDDVLKKCTFLVCPRTCAASAEQQNQERLRLISLGARIQLVPMETVNVSSSGIRAELEETGSTALLSPLVREYCALAGLYGLPARLEEPEHWLGLLFEALSTKRFAHSLGVALTARNLALVHHVDVNKAETAALLHDCAKCMPLKQMQEISQTFHLTDDPSLLASGSLLHAAVGAWMAADVYGVQDPEICQAIAAHTTGRPGMSRLDLVIYLADKIEPTRPSYPLLDKVRMMAPLSLERAVLTSMEGTVDYVTQKGKSVHPATLTTLEWLKKEVQ